MRSLRAKILVWCVVTLLLSQVCFVLATTALIGRSAQSPLRRINMVQMHRAIAAWEGGGAPALKSSLRDANAYLPAERFLTDRHGNDLITGQDRSSLLKQGQEELWLPRGGTFTMVIAEGAFRYITIATPPIPSRILLPYYGIVMAGVVALTWLLASHIATPLQRLSTAVQQFGLGKLDTRISFRRHDEIGELAVSFNQMASKIGLLIEGERQLLQDISHELRSPLARLSFAGELLRTADDREAAGLRLEREIERLASLVESLLQISRTSDHSRRVALSERVEVDGLLRQITNDCDLEAEAKGLHLAVAIDDSISIQGNRELLRRAFENVIRNAIRYAPEESPIEISLSNPVDAIVIEVRDFGPGVAPEMLERIFRPFFCVENERTTGQGGVGLGLAIAERAVQMHGGSIAARNAHPGLAVTIRLPLSPLPEPLLIPEYSLKTPAASA